METPKISLQANALPKNTEGMMLEIASNCLRFVEIAGNWLKRVSGFCCNLIWFHVLEISQLLESVSSFLVEIFLYYTVEVKRHLKVPIMQKFYAVGSYSF